MFTPIVNYTYSASLIRVIDGDTVALDIDLGFEVHFSCHVRLAGYNAPELHGPNREHAAHAKAELESLLTGKKLVVSTLIDNNNASKQSFSRYLANLFVVDGGGFCTDVCTHMTDKGFDVPQGQ